VKLIFRFAEDLINLPLSAIEAVLSGDNLRVESEDALFDFVIKWARNHYTNVEERREVLSKSLFQLVRFPNMSHEKLNDVISSDDLDSVCACKAALDALHLKAQAPHNISNDRYYTHFPVTVVESDTPIRECPVFWNITRTEMPLHSQHFRFGGTKFQFRCDPLEHVDGFELTISVIDYDDEERLDSDVIEAALSIQKFRSDDNRDDEEKPDIDIRSNNWPLRHLTRERLFLRVLFDRFESFPFMYNMLMHFRLRMTLRKVFGSEKKEPFY
jgi:hypothetical protein